MSTEYIFNAYIDQYSVKPAKNDKLKAHTSRVVEMCKTFATNVSLSDERTNLLIDAAWLHDIAKFDDDENHNTKSRVESAINAVIKGVPVDNAIYGIIEAHKKDFEPDEQYQLEAAILRICDKLDKFKKGKNDALKSCQKSIKKIENRIKKLPKEFLDTYNEFLVALDK